MAPENATKTSHVISHIISPGHLRAISTHRDAEDADRQHEDHSEQAREDARREEGLLRLARLVPREDELDDPLLPGT